jgi:hypothetical protein
VHAIPEYLPDATPITVQEKQEFAEQQRDIFGTHKKNHFSKLLEETLGGELSVEKEAEVLGADPFVLEKMNEMGELPDPKKLDSALSKIDEDTLKMIYESMGSDDTKESAAFAELAEILDSGQGAERVPGLCKEIGIDPVLLRDSKLLNKTKEGLAEEIAFQMLSMRKHVSAAISKKALTEMEKSLVLSFCDDKEMYETIVEKIEQLEKLSTDKIRLRMQRRKKELDFARKRLESIKVLCVTRLLISFNSSFRLGREPKSLYWQHCLRGMRNRRREEACKKWAQEFMSLAPLDQEADGNLVIHHRLRRRMSTEFGIDSEDSLVEEQLLEEDEPEHGLPRSRKVYF